MMTYRILGVIIGVLIGGPIGGLIGYFIGNALDKGKEAGSGGFRFGNFLQKNFLQAMFILMGHVAKADGHINEGEIAQARSFMQQLRLSEEQKHEAMRWFYQGKNQQFDLDALLLRLKPYKRGPHIRLLIQSLAAMVSVNGKAHPEQQRILHYICQFFDIPSPNFNYRRQNQQGGYSPFQQEADLSSAYRMLGVSKTADESTIRKAYRRLMSKHHPDKLAAKGASDAELKKATDTTHNIRTAYETIMQSKGITV